MTTQPVASRRDPVTGADIPDYICALNTAVALSISALDIMPTKLRTSEAVVVGIEQHLDMMSEMLPDDILLQARSLCFHIRNMVEDV